MKSTSSLSHLTDEQLIDEFNRAVSVVAYLLLEESYVNMLKNEFMSRDINCKLIGGITRNSFEYCVVLFQRSLYSVRELPMTMVNLLLLVYLQEYKPEMLECNPCVREYSNDEIVFGFKIKPERFRLDTNEFLKCLITSI